MTELQIFQKDEAHVRTVLVCGEPYFAAKDIACALGYSESSNASRLFSFVPDDWKVMKPIHTPGGIQTMLFISEKGLYLFLSRSDKPTALSFQRWIAAEVVPAIRKTGQYSYDQENQANDWDIPRTLPAALRLAADLAEKNEELRERIEINRPKIEFFDSVTSSSDAIDMNTAAKVLNLGIGRNELFQFLRQAKILMSTNLPYQEFIDCRYFRVVECSVPFKSGENHVYFKTLVYQKGLAFIRNRFLANHDKKVGCYGN